MKMIVLVGLPASGKSTWCYKHSADILRINQDEQGSRQNCVRMVKELLESTDDNYPNLTICIDRTNINKQQREHWINLAKEYGVENIHCIYFKSNPERCLERMIKRQNHPTIPESTSEQEQRRIINRFYKNLEEPLLSEGFSSIEIIDVDNSL